MKKADRRLTDLARQVNVSLALEPTWRIQPEDGYVRDRDGSYHLIFAFEDESLETLRERLGWAGGFGNVFVQGPTGQVNRFGVTPGVHMQAATLPARLGVDGTVAELLQQLRNLASDQRLQMPDTFGSPSTYITAAHDHGLLPTRADGAVRVDTADPVG